MDQKARFPVPRGFRSLLECLAREVLRSQPSDIYAFSALFFQKLVEIRSEAGMNPLDNPDIYDQFKLVLYNEALEKKLVDRRSTAVQMLNQAKTKAPEKSAISPSKPTTGDYLDMDLRDAGLNQAATRIQTRFRGFETRKKVYHDHPELEEHLKHHQRHHDEGVTSLSASGSGGLPPRAKTPEELHHEELDTKATKIQAAYRGFQVRKHPSKYGVKPGQHRKASADHAVAIYAPVPPSPHGEIKRSSSHEHLFSTDNAASKIQAGVRGYLTRKHVHQKKEKESGAATKIQAQFRGFRTRKNMEEQGLISPRSPRSSGSRSPRAGSGELMTPDSEVIPSDGGPLSNEADIAATKIQAQMRGYLTRKELEKEEQAAEKIQAAYRGFHVRKEYEDQRDEPDGKDEANGDRNQNQNPVFGTDF